MLMNNSLVREPHLKKNYFKLFIVSPTYVEFKKHPDTKDNNPSHFSAIDDL